MLCSDCANILARVPSRCYRCLQPTVDYRVCAVCAPQSSLQRLVVATPYRGAAKALVHRLKFERTQAAANEIAGLVAPLLRDMPRDAMLVHLPTATSRVRARGYDQARLLARELSKRSGLSRQMLLARVGQVRQVGAGRTARLQQLQYAFRPVRPGAITGRHVVLVDDVLTTGATLEVAARVLRRAGAAQVSAVVFAQA
jgi:ComF family protein